MENHRQRKTVDPCPSCGLHRMRCICEQIPRLNLQTRVSLIIHHKELKRTTNTGRLAMHALVNSQMYVRGLVHEHIDFSSILSGAYESVLLFPSDDAVDIHTFCSQRSLQSVQALQAPKQKPLQLIVSDGNWRQASKVNTRHPELRKLQRVKVVRLDQASSHLRKEHFADGCSTLEAIAIALGSIEGPVVGERLMALYQAKLNATLLGRGQPQD